MTKWKVPSDQIAVGDFIYNIVVNSDKLSKRTFAGEFSSADQELRIAEDQSKQRAARTLIHEWVHAQLYERGLVSLPQRLEEAICNVMEPAILQLLRDVELVKWLRSADKASHVRVVECQTRTKGHKKARRKAAKTKNRRRSR